MITPDFRKKMADSWFSYLQTQICKEFEYLEKNKAKFSKKNWSKNKIKIPMNKKTRSLNVAMSVAIVAAEALRQNNLLK